MSQKIEFTVIFRSSTDQGFQFEFILRRCGTGYRTRFQPSAWARDQRLDTASSLFGGYLQSSRFR
jgi:hypothetical protein